MADQSRWEEVERLYHEALGLDAPGRMALLAGVAAEVRGEVESLLAHDVDEDDFLDRPAVELAAPMLTGGERELAAGSMVGAYRIVRPVGRGGMGTVYEAEQQFPVRRAVALKMIKAGMDSEQLIARFQAERQALAMMDHPHIARVLDAGATEGGRPYFVMELVDGVPVTEYCTRHGLTVRERLALFVTICRAMEHAHQKGVLHRDIKPSNLLVARIDGQPVAKVIDFGIAKAMQAPLTERSLHTQVGTVVGTLDYMSPEQAGPASWDLDTRSDVYSLGAVLYELLTGVTPLNRAGMASSSELELLARVREVDPLAPKGEPEIGWVVMRALEKDRGRRYQSAGAFGDDIERYLRGDEVTAGAPSTVYRLGRMARRHRGALAVSAAFLVVLLGGAGFSLREALRARQAEREAAAVSEFLQNGLLAQVSAHVQASSNERPDPELKVRTALDRAAARIEGRFSGQPTVEAAVRHTIAAAYLDLGLPREAEGQVRRAMGLRAGSEAGLESANLLVLTLLRLDRVGEAEKVGQEVLATRRRRLGERHPATLTSMHNAATIELALGRDVKGEGLFGQVAALRREVLGETHPDTLASMNAHGSALGRVEKYEEAVALLVRVLDARRRVLGEEHPDTMDTKSLLARAYHDGSDGARAVGLLREVLPWQRRVLGAAHADSLRTQMMLGMSLASTREFGEAESLLVGCVEVAARAVGDQHVMTAAGRSKRANALNAAGKYGEAERIYRDLLAHAVAVRGPEHADSLRYMSNLAINLGLSGKFDEGARLFEQVLGMRRRVLGVDHPKTLSSLDAQGYLLLRAGRLREAERVYREVVSLRTRVLGAAHSNTRYSTLGLAEVFLGLGDRAGAERELRGMGVCGEAGMEGMRKSLLGASLGDADLARAGYEELRREEGRLPLMGRPELRGEVERARGRMGR